MKREIRRTSRWTGPSVRREKRLAAPFVWYGVTLAAGIGCCLLAVALRGNGLLAGLGSGIIASLLVALLIDAGSTRRRNRSDWEQFARLQDELKAHCYYFPSALMCFCPHDTEEERTLHVSVEEAYEMAAEEQRDAVAQTVLNMGKKAEELNRYANILSANPYFDEAYMKRLAHLILMCGIIGEDVRLLPRERECLQEEMGWLKQAVCALYPDLGGVYEAGIDLPG